MRLAATGQIFFFAGLAGNTPLGIDMIFPVQDHAAEQELLPGGKLRVVSTILRPFRPARHRTGTPPAGG